MARQRERDRGRGRERPREDNEEAVARAMRARIEAAADQGDEGDDENRERLGTWRLAKAGFPLLLLMLATVSGVKSCLEKGGEEERKKVLMALAATKGSPIPEPELVAMLAQISGSTVDSSTGQVICKKAKDAIGDEPTVEVDICGRKFQLSKSFAEAVKKVAEKVKEETDQCLDVDYGLRTNYEQYLIWLDALAPTAEDPLNTAWAAMPPCMSFHETGRAIDVNPLKPKGVLGKLGRTFDLDNWGGVEKAFWRQGIPGGYHGIYKDPRHFSEGEFTRKGHTDAIKQKAWWSDYGVKKWMHKKRGKK